MPPAADRCRLATVMLMFAGLGNPGAEYAGNRHNAGFLALDEIAERHGFSPWKAKSGAAVAEDVMKASELIEKSVDDLNKQLLDLREEQFKLRMAKATGQLGQTHLLKQAQRDIARVKTVLQQKAGQ